jgi:hypothetical protein
MQINPSQSGRPTMRVFPKLLFFGGVFVLIGFSPVWLQEPPHATHARGVLPQLGSNIDPRLTMQIAVSLVLLAATLFVILANRYQPKGKHWAYTTLGMVIGFWLKP